MLFYQQKESSHLRVLRYRILGTTFFVHVIGLCVLFFMNTLRVNHHSMHISNGGAPVVFAGSAKGTSPVGGMSGVVPLQRNAQAVRAAVQTAPAPKVVASQPKISEPTVQAKKITEKKSPIEVQKPVAKEMVKVKVKATEATMIATQETKLQLKKKGNVKKEKPKALTKKEIQKITKEKRETLLKIEKKSEPEVIKTIESKFEPKIVQPEVCAIQAPVLEAPVMQAPVMQAPVMQAPVVLAVSEVVPRELQQGMPLSLVATGAAIAQNAYGNAGYTGDISAFEIKFTVAFNRVCDGLGAYQAYLPAKVSFIVGYDGSRKIEPIDDIPPAAFAKIKEALIKMELLTELVGTRTEINIC